MAPARVSAPPAKVSPPVPPIAPENVPPAHVVMDLSNVQIQPFLDGINQSNANS